MQRSLSLWRRLFKKSPRIIPLEPRRFQNWLFVAAGRLLDFIGGLVWSRSLKDRPADPVSDVDDLSDDAIVEEYRKGREEPTIPLPSHFEKVRALTPRTLMKKSFDDHEYVPLELLALEYARAHTFIPIPALHRYARTRTEHPYTDPDTGLRKIEVSHHHVMVMQWIDGEPLSECWTSLPWWTKLRVIWTLRQYVAQLRQLPNPHPGRPGPLGDSPYRPPDGEIFYDTMETFDTVKDFVEWFIKRARPLPQNDGTPSPVVPFPDPSPLVFTHGDLHPGNVILDKSGRIWMIDWAFSGFYPQWFEYFTAKRVSCGLQTAAPASWRLLLPLITGPDFMNESWAEKMRVVRYQHGKNERIGLNVLWSYI